MKALYPGRCVCHEEIEVGEEILMDPETGQWKHEECLVGFRKEIETKFQGTSLEDMGF